MSWTKRQYIEQAMELIGLASWAFEMSAEQYASALRQLDAMVAAWNKRGILLGYPLPGNPLDSDLDQDSGCPDEAHEAIYNSLAIRLCPVFGKSAPPEIMKAAHMAYLRLLEDAAAPIEMQFDDSIPAGQGSKPWRNDTQVIEQAEDDPLTFLLET